MKKIVCKKIESEIITKPVTDGLLVFFLFLSFVFSKIAFFIINNHEPGIYEKVLATTYLLIMAVIPPYVLHIKNGNPYSKKYILVLI
jgi:hypothetical protein